MSAVLRLARAEQALDHRVEVLQTRRADGPAPRLVAAPQDFGIVWLAADQGGHVGLDPEFHQADRKVERADGPAGGVERRVGLHRHDHQIVVAGDPGDRAFLVAAALQLVEADPQAEGFDEAAQTAGDPEDAGLDLQADIAGAQDVGAGGLGQILGIAGIAHHHVGAAIDDLALAPSRQAGAGRILDPQLAAGNGPADAVGVGLQKVRGQVGDTSGGLGLAVHDHQPGADLGGGGLDAADHVGGHATAGLGQGGAGTAGDCPAGRSVPAGHRYKARRPGW